MSKRILKSNIRAREYSRYLLKANDIAIFISIFIVMVTLLVVVIVVVVVV